MGTTWLYLQRGMMRWVDVAGSVQVDTTVASLPSAAVADVLTLLAEYMPECPHLEFILKWLRSLCLKHGSALQVSTRLPFELSTGL